MKFTVKIVMLTLLLQLFTVRTIEIAQLEKKLSWCKFLKRPLMTTTAYSNVAVWSLHSHKMAQQVETQYDKCAFAALFVSLSTASLLSSCLLVGISFFEGYLEMKIQQHHFGPKPNQKIRG
jgi:hypothetical protein